MEVVAELNIVGELKFAREMEGEGHSRQREQSVQAHRGRGLSPVQSSLCN